jgi:hypothetical protein
MVYKPSSRGSVPIIYIQFFLHHHVQKNSIEPI